MPLSPFLQKILVVDKRLPVATDNPLLTPTDKAVHTAAMSYIIKTNTVGLSIGVIKDGLLSKYNYGEVVKDSGRLPGAGSIFEIGSITKTFTATALAHLVMEGKVGITD